jgi:hypothetical protein
MVGLGKFTGIPHMSWEKHGKTCRFSLKKKNKIQ